MKQIRLALIAILSSVACLFASPAVAASFAYDSFLDDTFAGSIVKTDTFKCALVTGYTPNQITHTRWSDVSANEITGTGYTARIAITVADHNESPVDPAQLTIKILEPGQPVATATQVKDSAGQYHHDIRLTRPGKWYWRVETDGTPSAASEGQISVSPSRFS